MAFASFWAEDHLAPPNAGEDAGEVLRRRLSVRRGVSRSDTEDVSALVLRYAGAVLGGVAL